MNCRRPASIDWGPAPPKTVKRCSVVLFPVNVGGKLGQAAEARFALAQHRLGVLPLQELPDLAADHAHGLQQALIRRPDFAAVRS